jgi:4-aminobutyrate aminotransferase-like enzyme
VIDFIDAHALLKNAANVGADLRERLEELQRKHPAIGDIRGMGLMQGIELVEDRKTKAPAGDLTAQVMEAARAGGLLVGKSGIYGNVLRITPPLNIGRADVDEFARLLDRSLLRATAVAGKG